MLKPAAAGAAADGSSSASSSSEESTLTCRSRLRAVGAGAFDFVPARE